MTIRHIQGNIFTTKCQTLVNTVNCVGVMGAGIALECRLRYPKMHDRYVALCEQRKLDIGLLWIFKADDRWILNFPTKKHWKYPTKPEYLHTGLQKFVDTYQSKGVKSIAFPALGASHGGLSEADSLEIMQRYLSPLDLEIEIYRYDASSRDDLYEETRSWLLSQDVNSISKTTGIRGIYVRRVLEAMEDPAVAQLNQLSQVPGVGIRTLEKMFSFAQKNRCRPSLPLAERDGVQMSLI